MTEAFAALHAEETRLRSLAASSASLTHTVLAAHQHGPVVAPHPCSTSHSYSFLW